MTHTHAHRAISCPQLMLQVCSSVVLQTCWDLRIALTTHPSYQNASHHCSWSVDYVTGRPIKWDAIIRLEEASVLSADLALTLGVPVRRETMLPMTEPFAAAFNSKSEACRQAPSRWRIARVCNPSQLNVTISSTASARPNGTRMHFAASALRAAVLSHKTLACSLCHIYGQDFDCLDYPFPSACAEPTCLRTCHTLLTRSEAEALGHLERNA